MMLYVYYMLAGFGLSYALWVFYLAIMNLKRVKEAGKLGRVALVLGTPALIVGLLLDFAVNLTVFTLLLLELPQELTVTSRLKRHKRDSQGWRLKVTNWFASELLDNFDPSGTHTYDSHTCALQRPAQRAAE